MKPHRKNNINQPTPRNSQGLNHQPRSTPGGIHGSSCIYSRGWPYLASMEGEVLGTVKAQCPSIEECQDTEEGVGSWMEEHHYRGRGKEDGIRGLC